MHLSSREQWRLNARYIARSGAEAAAYLHGLLQQPTQAPPPSSISVPKSFALASPFKAIMLSNKDSFFAKTATLPSSNTTRQGPEGVTGSAQVTVVACETQGTSEPPCILQGSLAGASPHAPDPPRRARKKRPSIARKNFTIRMSDDIRAKLEAKAAAVESYPSAYVSKLVADDLCLPIDQNKIARSRGVQEQIAALTVAINKQGALFNQIAAALNRGQPCPVSRQEIDDAWRRHMAATNAIIKLGFD